MIVTSIEYIDEPTRAAIARVSNIIRVLANHFVPINDILLLEAYEWAVEQQCSIKDLLQDEMAEIMLAAVSAFI